MLKVISYLGNKVPSIWAKEPTYEYIQPESLISFSIPEINLFNSHKRVSRFAAKYFSAINKNVAAAVSTLSLNNRYTGYIDTTKLEALYKRQMTLSRSLYKLNVFYTEDAFR